MTCGRKGPDRGRFRKHAGAYEAAVQQAADDGVITAEQATLLLQAPGYMGGIDMHGFHGGHGH
jgi:hypothetical protein